MGVGAGLYMCDVVKSSRSLSHLLMSDEFLLRSLYAITRPSVVCQCLSSVTFVRPTQAVQIFGNISTALGTLAIR